MPFTDSNRLQLLPLDLTTATTTAGRTDQDQLERR